MKTIKKKTLCATVALLSLMMIVCFPMFSGAYVSEFPIDTNQYSSNGRIDMNFSYNNVRVMPSDNGCSFQGTITNDSSVLQSVSVTVQAVDDSEKPLWNTTIQIPSLDPSDSYQFQQNIDDCPNTVPYRLRFGISQ